MARARLVATALALAAAAAGCAGGEPSGIEDEISARHETFPSEAQARGTPPWPEGRLAGDCGREAGDVYLCFYEDARGRQGYACFATGGGALRVLSAAGAHDSRRRFDHDGRALPPDGRCAD